MLVIYTHYNNWCPTYLTCRPCLNCIDTHYTIVQTGIHGTVNVSKLLIHKNLMFDT